MNLQTITIDLDTHAVVPREPDDRMLDAGVAMALQASVFGEGGWSRYIRALYLQLLSAAPKFESAEYPPPPKCVGKPCLNRGPECEDDERCVEEPAHE